MKYNMNQEKRVSVVMCTYNGEKYLREQIDSILSQTYPIYELIIQDDCSTDRTVEIVREYQMKDERVKLFCNPKSLGFNYNFSKAFTRAMGDYIASTDQDDIWRLDKIEVLLKNIEDNSLLFHDSYVFYSDASKPIGMKNGNNVIYNSLYLLLKPFVPGHQCFFNKNIIPLYSQIVEMEHNVSYDSLLLVVASLTGKVKYINEGLVFWRRYQGATSYNSSSKYGSIIGMIKAVNSLFINNKRKISSRYFTLIQNNIQIEDKEIQRIISYMAKGTIFALIEACFYCMKHRKKLYPQINLILSLQRSFFVPLYFLRDSTNFIIH